MKKALNIILLFLCFVVFVGFCNPQEHEWKNIGKIRITTYCAHCNDPHGYESSSGKTLKYGYAACRWLPNGTLVNIEGDIFEIVDTCGTEAIDIFIDTETCQCNINEYKQVAICEP